MEQQKNEKLGTCKHHVTECKTLHEAIHGEEAVSTTDVIFLSVVFDDVFFSFVKIKKSGNDGIARWSESGENKGTSRRQFFSSSLNVFEWNITISFIEVNLLEK